MLLDLHGVNRFYGPIHALNDVSLSIKKSSIGLLARCFFKGTGRHPKNSPDR